MLLLLGTRIVKENKKKSILTSLTEDIKLIFAASIYHYRENTMVLNTTSFFPLLSHYVVFEKGVLGLHESCDIH